MWATFFYINDNTASDLQNNVFDTNLGLFALFLSPHPNPIPRLQLGIEIRLTLNFSDSKNYLFNSIYGIFRIIFKFHSHPQGVSSYIVIHVWLK